MSDECLSQLMVNFVEDDPIAPPLVFSIFAFMRGIGNITSGELWSWSWLMKMVQQELTVSTGPISGALLKHDTFPNGAGVYGFHNYVSNFVILSGISACN